MANVAKLVTVHVTTRVVVDENATDEQIMAVAIPRCILNLANDGPFDHITDGDIENDTECPVQEDEK